MSINADAWNAGKGDIELKGIRCQQFPSDVTRYVELIRELKPSWFLEIGRWRGGTALYLAEEMAFHRGILISVDIDYWYPREVPDNGIYLVGDSISAEIVQQVQAKCKGRGIVALDGDHSSAQVYAEIITYAPMANYLIVEDTVMGELEQFDDGPHLALEKWFDTQTDFVRDPDPIPTQHPGGWLRRRNI